jgi:hypothetical protein
MPPLPTISGGDLPSVKLPGDCIEACMACRLDVPNNRQDVSREAGRLRLSGHTHVLHGPGRAPRLSGRQSRLGAFRDRLALVFGYGRQDVDGHLLAWGWR